MALVDEVTARVPSQVLIELTNPRDSDETAADATKLAQAATSVQTRFAIYAEEAYSSSNDYHVELCVHGVVGLLQMWGSASWSSAKKFWEWFREECERYKAIGPRARIVPTTNSPYTPSNEEWDATEPIRPWSDDREFYDILSRRGGVIDDLTGD